MNIFTFFDDARKKDLSAISAHYDALIEAETKVSEQRIERLRELVSVEKAESKTRIDALHLSRESTLAQIAQRYELPEPKQDAGTDVKGEGGVVVTGSAHNASGS